ncbi:MAG: SPFH domain-containing protein [Alphaproteobacteria bacterium]|jgi:regulator of protease activity HflC (stomatin/prohibitin superfamily)|nr:SPFH domain-containing protein [Alphaproteobacteria bacterium]
MSEAKLALPSKENPVTTTSGWLMLVALIALLAVGVVLVRMPIIGVPIILLSVFLMIGFLVLKPNESAVLTLFGRYVGTVRKDGFHWVNPFYAKQKISLRVRNFTTLTLKVNDKVGNPIDVAAVVGWLVRDTAQAAFDVDDYEGYIKTQCEMALRDVVSTHPYDATVEEHISLRGNTGAVSELLKESLQRSINVAGLEILEMRITHLAYAPEIASIMLRRQQAVALIQAREKMVDGAIGMIKMALERFESDGITDMTSAQKAVLVSNMMMVLLSDEGAQPVIPAATS